MLPSNEALEITPLELSDLLNNEAKPSIRLIDCREEDEFAICRIEGAELVPLSRFAELAHARFFAQDEACPIVIYCHHGMRSLHATHFLRERGLDQVWSLSGGIDLWSSSIDPSVPRY